MVGLESWATWFCEMTYCYKVALGTLINQGDRGDQSDQGE
jgi:hypothetical protein